MQYMQYGHKKKRGTKRKEKEKAMWALTLVSFPVTHIPFLSKTDCRFRFFLSLFVVHAVRAQKEKGNQKKGKGKSYVGL